MDWKNFLQPTFEQQVKGISIFIKFLAVVLIAISFFGIGTSIFRNDFSGDALIASFVLLVSSIFSLQLGYGLARLERFVIPISIGLVIVALIFSLPNILGTNKDSGTLGIVPALLLIFFVLVPLWRKRDSFNGSWIKPIPLILFFITVILWLYIFMFK